MVKKYILSIKMNVTEDKLIILYGTAPQETISDAITANERYSAYKIEQAFIPALLAPPLADGLLLLCIDGLNDLSVSSRAFTCPHVEAFNIVAGAIQTHGPDDFVKKPINGNLPSVLRVSWRNSANAVVAAPLGQYFIKLRLYK
jgi:hypothetical protein